MKLVFVEQCYVARDTVDIEGHFRTKCPNNVVFMLTRVNSTNVLDEGLRIGEIERRMNSKVKSVKQGVYRK
jgi:hypothetical protein